MIMMRKRRRSKRKRTRKRKRKRKRRRRNVLIKLEHKNHIVIHRWLSIIYLMRMTIDDIHDDDDDNNDTDIGN